jgi:hypothetical protein
MLAGAPGNDFVAGADAPYVDQVAIATASSDAVFCYGMLLRFSYHLTCFSTNSFISCNSFFMNALSHFHAS